ncbi:MAG TPA: MFS transporter [Sphaerochaeta sp.]|nr:MFS transporter [Spirochaetota bacterium]NLV61458.1 MFS transporter [Spirochaetales bacterium]HOE84898.1 MFS transporter [Sphaerochaeta sp.]HOQ94974.1 MFS transporter [Sphaerochaeta sp.]HPK47321.1 MFS transporter [Sphaerochaeta sp.]
MFNKTNLKLGLVQGFYWMASCVFVSFLVRLLSGYGYSDYHSGIALTFAAFASLVIQPFVGRLADTVKSVRRLLITSVVIAIGAAILLDLFHEYRLLAYLLILIIFGSFRSLIYVIDLWSLAIAAHCKDFSYGFTRSFGAVFYAVGAVFYGVAIDQFGTRIIIPCFCLFSVLTIGVALCVKSSQPRSVTEQRKDAPPLVGALRILFANKAYRTLLISYTLVEMSCIAHQNYLTRKFEALGAGDFHTGLSLLIMGLLQLIPLLLHVRIIRRASPPSLMLICLIGLNMRTIIMAFSSTPVGTVCSFLTEPFAFGLYIGTILYYMGTVLPSNVRYLGMTLYAAVTAGVGGMVGNYVAGYLSVNYGVLAMMKFISIPAMVGLVVYVLFFPRDIAGHVLDG